jgi:tRNA dimethylallyltransferase
MKVVPFLVGPTGIGKTNLSILLAQKLPIEIISADSRQVYRNLDIGTAKPTRQILNKIPHHFINYLSPETDFSAGKFGRSARRVIKQIFNRDLIPLVVGGSGFYIQALIDGLSDITVRDERIRHELKDRVIKEGIDTLYHELFVIDPDLAKKLQNKDKQRIVRGLEVYYASGHRLSELQTIKAEKSDFMPFMIGLTAERQYLYSMINHRVDQMLEKGLIEEVTSLKEKGFSREINALNTVGYKEVFEYLDNKINYETMIINIKKNSRHYAKRQLTWFHRDKRISWISIDEKSDFEKISDTIIERYHKYLVKT